MRIQGPSRGTHIVPGRAARRSSGAGAIFDAGGEAAAPSRAATTTASQATNGIDALIALQAVEDPLFAKRKAMRRGHSMLDTLDDIKADLLLGKVPEGRLNKLVAFVGQARERCEPNLDAVLDDIELRARVELAKLGHFPAF